MVATARWVRTLVMLDAATNEQCQGEEKKVSHKVIITPLVCVVRGQGISSTESFKESHEIILVLRERHLKAGIRRHETKDGNAPSEGPGDLG